MYKIGTFCARYADRLIWVLISGYIIIFSYLVLLKYFSFCYIGWDFASDVNILWNTVHGRPFYYSFMQQSILGYHLFLILALIAPIYAVFQHPVTLLFLQTIFLALAAYPLYLLARLKLSRILALAISFAYLMYPTIGYINLYDTHSDIYVLFFLFYALYFFEKEKFLGFLGFIFLALLCKENVSFVVFMLGVYGLLRRRSAKWVLFPLVLGAGWFILAIKVVIPYFAKDRQLYSDGFMFTVYYNYLGKNIAEMFYTLISKPWLVAKIIFTKDKLVYLFEVFAPGSFLALLSPASLLITLPVFMQNLLSSAPATHASIQYHYFVMAIPFIFFAIINTFKKLFNYQRIFEIKGLILFGFLAVAIVSAFLLGAPQTNSYMYAATYTVGEFARARQKMIKLIPPNASVIADSRFLAKLSQRKEVYSMHLVFDGRKMYSSEKYELPSNLEYALVDFNDFFTLDYFFPAEAPENIRHFLKDGNWGVLKGWDNIMLFNKDIKGARRLFEEVENPIISHPLNININQQIMFLGYDLIPESFEGGRILHLVYYWQRLADIKGQLGMFVDFLDSNNQVKLIKAHVVGYKVCPLESWQKDKVFKEHHYIYFPEGIDISNGKYSIRAEMIYLSTGQDLPVFGENNIDSDGRIILTNLPVEIKSLLMGE